MSYCGLLSLPDNARSDHIAHQLAKDGILVSTAEAFCVTPDPPNALRLALGTPTLPEFARTCSKQLGRPARVEARRHHHQIRSTTHSRHLMARFDYQDWPADMG